MAYIEPNIALKKRERFLLYQVKQFASMVNQ
jgi:hypothetical protein